MRWLGPEHRCLVPFNSFSEFNKAEGGDIWFAPDETRPLSCFAGIWVTWTSVRKLKEGETTNDIYAFHHDGAERRGAGRPPQGDASDPYDAQRGRDLDDRPSDEALKLQRPLPDGALQIVARGVKEDPVGSMT